MVFSKKSGKQVTGKTLNKIFKGYRRRYRKFFDFNPDKNSPTLISYSKNETRIEAEKRLDGIFVLLCTGNLEKLTPKKVVKSYKNLKEVEMLHDDLKNFVDVRPIRHWLEKRVRAHVFVCVLSLLLKRTFEINDLKSKSVTEALEEIGKVKLVKYKVTFSEKEDRHKVIPKVTRVNPTQKKYFKMVGIKNPMSLEKLAWCEKKK
jgi:transposase